MGCSRCNLHKSFQNQPIIPHLGVDNPKYVFVGEIFSANKADTSIDSIGMSFEELLKLADIEFSEISLINSVQCWQKDGPKVTKKHLDACFFNIHQYIKQVKPELIVAMGNSALYQSTGMEGIERYRGKIVESTKLGCKVLPMFHPSIVKHSESKQKKVQQDFKNIKTLLAGKPFEVVHYPYILIDTLEGMKEAHKDLLGKEVKFDIESTGLDPYNDQVTLIQLATNIKRIYIIDIRVIEEKEGVIKLLKDILENSALTGQDLSFDFKWMKVKYDIDPKNYDFDTCLAEYSLTGMKDNDLTTLTDKYVPESAGYDSDVKLCGGAHKVMDKPKLLQYSSDDIGVMFKIKRKQHRQLMKRNCMWKNGFTAEWCFQNMTLPCNRVLTKMSTRGLRYNVKKLEKLDIKYEKKAKRALMRAESLDGVKATEKHFHKKFNPRSTHHIRWMMLDYYGLPVLKETGKGQPSIGKDELKLYAKDHNNDYAKIMVKYRSIQNIRDNFLGGVLPKLHNGIAHPDYTLHGTASGRPAAKNPNTLNYPNIEEIRECVEADTDNNYCFLYSDLSQIEVRLASVIYYDENLIQLCNNIDKDFHCQTAAKAFNVDYDELFKWHNKYEEGSKEPKALKMHELRRAAKTITFGILYQMGIKKLAYDLGITEKEAAKFIEDYFRGFPGLQEKIEFVKDFVNKNGYMDTWFGFRRQWQFYGEEEFNAQREAVNHPIQGTAWNLVELILARVDDFLETNNFKSQLVWQNYDSLAIHTYEPEKDDVANETKRIMETSHKEFDQIGDVDIPTDIKHGPNLSALRKLI